MEENTAAKKRKNRKKIIGAVILLIAILYCKPELQEKAIELINIFKNKRGEIK